MLTVSNGLLMSTVFVRSTSLFWLKLQHVAMVLFMFCLGSGCL